MHKLMISFIGAGHMATAMIQGLIKMGFPANQIIATNISLDKLDHLHHDVIKMTDNNEAAAQSDVLILAVKPQSMMECLEQLTLENQPLIISIAAGIPVALLEQGLGQECAIVRSMPNMPAFINRGATALFANQNVSDEQRALAEEILQSLGITVWLDDEALIDVVIAVAASAPAYYFYLMEILQDFAVEHGLNAEDARLLIQRTCAGTGELAAYSEASLGELKQQIMSPGGTTEAAINYLEKHHFTDTVQAACKRALLRSQELAKQ